MIEPESEFIEEGHGLEDISCPCGSRWIWWLNPFTHEEEWRQVVYAPDCDCGEPPRPYKEPNSSRKVK